MTRAEYLEKALKKDIVMLMDYDGSRVVGRLDIDEAQKDAIQKGKPYKIYTEPMSDFWRDTLECIYGN